MNDWLNFTGKVALVTGAASGMGLATARAFAEAGAAVVLADVRGALVQTVAEQLVADGHHAIGVSCDVSDDAQWRPWSRGRSPRSDGSTPRSTTPA